MGAVSRRATTLFAALFFCGFVVLAQGHLTLKALPDLLFNSSGVHRVELGAVVRAHCISTSSSAPTVTWVKDDITLTNDPPHVRIRASTSDSEVTSVLTIDNFISGDNGDYFCMTSNGTHTLNSTTLSLTVIDDDTISLFRDPPEFEIVADNNALKTYDTIQDNRTAYELGMNFEPSVYVSSCCQTLRCTAVMPGDQRMAANIDLLTVTWLKDGEEIVHSSGRTPIVRDLRYATSPDETRYVSHLRLLPFMTMDIGVYQCVYSDFDTDRELVFGSPIKLDSNNETAATLAAVSPAEIVLDPPEKLVIEVESSGGYFRHAWYRNDEEQYPNGDNRFRQDTPERFSEFFQVFVQDPTTSSDHGVYRVELIDDSIQMANVFEMVEFVVTPPVTLSVEALNTTTVAVIEGDDVNISCIARANPLPSDITWSFGGNSTSFNSTSLTESLTAHVPSEGMFSFTEGNRTSTLHITSAESPTHSGTYTCSSSNDSTTLSDTITVEVQVPPEVSVSATRSRILIGHSINITCSIARTVPTDYTIEWTLTNTSEVTTVLAETGETLSLTNISEGQFGVYTCNATNTAGLSGSADITIEEGVAPSASIAAIEVAVTGDDVTLNCSATGDTPLVYQWTMQDSDIILNSDNTTGVLILTSITGAEFGTYVCTVSNNLANTTANIDVIQATVPTSSSGGNVSVVELETLELVAMFEFNLELDSICWTQDGSVLQKTPGGITITNSDLGPPNATSTLTRAGVRRQSGGGSYIANATNRAGSVTATFSVEILYPPDVSVTATLTRLPVNGSTNLTCSVLSSNPADFTVAWTLTDTSGSTTTELADTSQTLQLSAITENQFGTYTCNVTNSYGLSGQDNITIVQGAIPEVTINGVDPAIPGDNVTLVCSATGDTPLVYQWTMQGSDIILNSDNTTGELSLTSITGAEFGTYVCTVSNALGMATSDIALEQGVAPTASDGGSVRVSVGADLVLIAVFSDFNLPLDSIAWTHNSSVSLVNGVAGVTIANTGVGPPSANSTLTRSAITGVSYGGIYTVTASNRAGSSSATYTVEITDAPNILNETVLYQFNESTQAELSCLASGIPPVTVYWQFEGENITTGPALSISNTLELRDDVYITTSDLSITSVQRSNDGLYTCIASNGVPPHDSLTSNLTVNFAPVIEQGPMAVSVLAPDPVLLTCTAAGMPSPDIVWVKQDSSGADTEFSESGRGVEITVEESTAMSTSTLTIPFSDSLDTANYSCVAENSLGTTTSQPAPVNVFVSPLVEPERPLYFAIEFQPQELTCSAMGVPAPAITFSRDGMVLGDGSLGGRVSLRDTVSVLNDTTRVYEVNRTLEILSPLGSDTGFYACQASIEVLNQTLTDNVTFTLIVQVAPEIDVPPVDDIVISPQTAIFYCEAFGTVPPNITWLMNGNTLASQGDIEIAIDTVESRRNSTLYVRNTVPNDAGNYTCMAESAAGIVSVSAELIVNVVPEITEPGLETVVTVNEGMTATFECTATGIPGPTITWRRMNSTNEFTEDSRVVLGEPTPPQPVTTPNGTIFSVTRQLNLTTTRDSDSGFYFCQASGGDEDILNVELPFELFVRVAPVITAAPENRTELRGTLATFVCNVTGRPRPEISWWRMDDSSGGDLSQVVEELDKILIESEPVGRERERAGSLTVLNVQPSDAGVYVCRAENEAGRVESQATLTVHVIPEIDFPTDSYGYRTIQFSETIFECNATGIPAPDIEFFVNGSLLESGDNISLLDPVSEPIDITGSGDVVELVTRRLRISPTLDSDSNNYSCVATNVVGTDAVEFDLIVWVAPVIVVAPDSLTVLEGESAMLFCEAEGRPPPIITWLQQSTEVEGSGRVSIRAVQRGPRRVMSTLTIDSALPVDAETYSCSATNLAGEAVSTAELTVHVVPEIQFLLPSPLLVVNQTDSAVFMCNATAIPAPVISWSMGEQDLSDVSSGDLPTDLLSRVTITETDEQEHLTPDGIVLAVTSILTIESTRGSDSGSYRCTASNEVGPSMMPEQAEENTTLYVQVPPAVVALQRDVIGNESGSATLQFRIDEAEPRVQLSGLRWFYSNDISQEGVMEDITNLTNRTTESQLITSFSSDGLFFNLTVVNIQQARLEGEETDEGRYFLQATNPAGSSVAYVNLQVYGPPLIILPPEDQFVIAGEPAVFSCDVLAFPAHQTEWTFVNSDGDTTIIITTSEGSNSKYSIDNTTSSSSFGQLVVWNTQYSDRGQYICTAINEVDSRTASANLRVHVPPVIEATLPDVEITIDQQAILACLVTGFPRPEITWLREEEIFPGDSDRISVYEFETSVLDGSGSGSGVELVGSGLIGSGAITNLIRDMLLSDNNIQSLGELGVVSVLAFEQLAREDTGNYTCTATNSLPGRETGILTVNSSLILLTVLEVPDVVEDLSSGARGARWVVLDWALGFDGNSDIISLRIRIIQGDSRTLEIPVSRPDTNSYNVTESILPFTSYDFGVAVCNVIGCGVFTDAITVMTEEDAPDTAPTITNSLSPSSTSLLLSWSPPPSDKQNGVLTDYIVYYTSDAEQPMSVWETVSTPANSITLTRLSIFTEYSVAVAASTAAGVGPFDSVEVQTLNDTCSKPLEVESTNVGETTIDLQWKESAIQNGIVDSYLVSYVVEGTTEESTVSVSELKSVQLSNLKPFTRYTITVTCVNGAGPGNSSDPVTQRTNSAPPVVESNAIVQTTEQPGGRQFVVTFNKPDDTNGPISHYQAVAVKVPQDLTLGSPDTDFSSFDSIDNVYSTDCEEVTELSAYIAAEFGSDSFQGNSLRFTFGNEEETLNDRPRYSNGPLCYSTSYAFFLRVYNDMSDNRVRSVRQTSDDRQYTRFSSSGYVTHDTGSSPSSSDNSGTIAAVVVVLLLLLIAAVVAAVIVVLVFMRRNRITIYKTHTTAAEEFDTSFFTQNEHVQLTEYRGAEEGDGHTPIPVGQFASLVEQLHINENCGFGELFKEVQEKSAKNSVDACVHDDNRSRNRYANIQCFDCSRCVLTPVEGHEHDYINANFIDGYNREKEYIATQGPLPTTVGDFWRLVWDYKVPTIVMLTNLTEKMKVKCSQYWPNGESQTYADITVTFKSATNNADFVVRTFEVKRASSDEVRQVHQFHYISWPDFGVPLHATPLLHFLRRIRDTHTYSNDKPILVHCSAGVGRTGTLIAVDVELQRAQKEGVVDPFNYILKMREQRNHIVQTEAQYVFLYDAILEGTTSGGTEIPVEGLRSRMKELELTNQEGETGYYVEFNRLRQYRVNIKEFTDANDTANQFKNRLANALPYNTNRVYLTPVAGVSGSDYINASFIDGYTRKGAFIATQGPLPETVNDFWRMVTERNVHVIVMLTQLEEKGKEMCARYWPKEVSVPETRGPVSVELLSEEPFQDYIHRKLKLDQTVKGSTVSRVVHHFQFTAWPENGAPEEGAGMIDLIGQVLRVQQQTGDKPIVIHCSAGIGRTGAFCALSTAIERVKSEGLIDVFHTVKHLRTQRPHMVQTPEQYMFCYRAISEYVASLDQYSNFL